MKLTEPAERFILHWGEMGQKWGVNRSQAQIHALLHLAPRPMPADEIAETLAIARSNVSTALKELQAWKLVRVERTLGDRRDHFVAVDDMIELVTNVVEGRRTREFAPTIERVRDCVADAEADGETPGAGLTLRLWPGDLRLVLGRACFHGRWVDWSPRVA